MDVVQPAVGRRAVEEARPQEAHRDSQCRLNKDNLQGKDHWPYATAMITGPGITGGRSIGAYDPESWFGSPIDLHSGELYDGGTLLSAEHLGATLMALGDVDPEIWLPGISPIDGALL